MLYLYFDLIYTWSYTMLEPTFVLMNIVKAITDGIFETGAYKVLSKSQNPTVLGQGGSSSTQYSN